MEYSAELVDALSAAVDAANDKWNQFHGDPGPVVPWDALGEREKDLIRKRTVIILAMLDKGMDDHDIAETIQDAWRTALVNDGWTLGDRKDVANKVHTCLKPLPELPEWQRRKCYLAIGIIRELTRKDA